MASAELLQILRYNHFCATTSCKNVLERAISPTLLKPRQMFLHFLQNEHFESFLCRLIFSNT